MRGDIHVKDRFSDLVVIEIIEIERERTMSATRYRCRCRCGARITTEARRLRNRQVTSCGHCSRTLHVASDEELTRDLARCALRSCRKPVDPDRKSSHGKVHCSDDCSAAAKKLRNGKFSAEFYRKHRRESLAYAAAYREAHREEIRRKERERYKKQAVQLCARKRAAYWRAKQQARAAA